MTRLRISAVAVLLLLATPAPGDAQFRVRLTPAVPGDTVCAFKATTEEDDPCVAHWGRKRIDSIHPLDKENREEARRLHLASVSDLRGPYGPDGVRWFRSFESTFDENQIYVASSLLSGLIGPFVLDVSLAKAIRSVDEDEDETEDGRSREALREGASRVMRLVNNGGSATARLLLPAGGGSGTSAQFRWGIYTNVGMVGPPDVPDSLALTVGGAAEALATFAVRNVDTHEEEGEVLLGLRGGVQWVEGSRNIDPTTDRDKLWFGQVAVGIRKGEATLLALLFTFVKDHYRAFVPRLQLAVSAPGS